MATLQRGKAIQDRPEVSDIRELSRSDLTHLTAPRPVAPVQTLRDNHHRIARAVASGLSNIDIGLTCGVSNTRIHQLRNDPSFIELVAHYRSLLTVEWLKEADPVVELLGSIRQKALAQIEGKLEAAEESGEFLPSRDLANFAELGLDRTGYGKVNKNVNINVDFAAKLEAARTRSSRAAEVRGVGGSSPDFPQQGAAPASAPQRPVPPSPLRRL